MTHSRFRMRVLLPFCFMVLLPLARPVQGADAGARTADTPTSASARLAALVLDGARAEAARQTPYIMNYEVIAYPGGDVPAGTGVCTDLVVRAFRKAGIDLQKSLHEDRVAHPEAYPTKLWDVKRADANIDHRRCQNLVVWFRRHTRSLPNATIPDQLAQWRGGDVVFYVRPGADHPWHVAIVSDRKAPDGMPLIIDSIPPATSESHRLDEFSPIHSHYRYEGESGAAEAKAKKPKSPR